MVEKRGLLWVSGVLSFSCYKNVKTAVGLRRVFQHWQSRSKRDASTAPGGCRLPRVFSKYRSKRQPFRLRSCRLPRALPTSLKTATFPQAPAVADYRKLFQHRSKRQLLRRLRRFRNIISLVSACSRPASQQLHLMHAHLQRGRRRPLPVRVQLDIRCSLHEHLRTL